MKFCPIFVEIFGGICRFLPSGPKRCNCYPHNLWVYWTNLDHGNVPWRIGKRCPDRSSTNKHLSFGKKIVKIGPVDPEIIGLRAIIKQEKNYASKIYVRSASLPTWQNNFTKHHIAITFANRTTCVSCRPISPISRCLLMICFTPGKLNIRLISTAVEAGLLTQKMYRTLIPTMMVVFSTRFEVDTTRPIRELIFLLTEYATQWPWPFGVLASVHGHIHGKLRGQLIHQVKNILQLFPAHLNS